MKELKGIKYVSSDASDWFLSYRNFSPTLHLLFAPEPKLQWFALGMGEYSNAHHTLSTKLNQITLCVCIFVFFLLCFVFLSKNKNQITKK